PTPCAATPPAKPWPSSSFLVFERALVVGGGGFVVPAGEVAELGHGGDARFERGDEGGAVAAPAQRRIDEHFAEQRHRPALALGPSLAEAAEKDRRYRDVGK